ncbi:hypothetical protein Pyn_15165 [Prunus yedoensis var. nudiflora]|uniref:Uncharacterized protein n=1 Tax=Prunus yedoensis var. nudiflora TaxID=2094558 RepID=A0A314USS0_PRUYE|nr:hypothetical protein Pyn_15165 [Prunus yedoensis var. nudiflora]
MDHETGPATRWTSYVLSPLNHQLNVNSLQPAFWCLLAKISLHRRSAATASEMDAFGDFSGLRSHPISLGPRELFSAILHLGTDAANEAPERFEDPLAGCS